jgi:hypothetical protein
MAFTKIADMVDGRPMNARPRSNAALHRDAALARIGRARRWLIAGAAGLTGGLAAFVSATAHGHTLRKGAVSPASTRSTGPSTNPARMPPLASPSSLGLQGPDQNPQPSSSGPSQAQSSAPSQSQSSSPQPQSQAPAASTPSPAPAPSSSGVVSGGS